jgi:hypothetical protein
MRQNSSPLQAVAIVIALALLIGLGVSTVYRAGPYQVGTGGSGVKTLSRWERRLGFSLDEFGGKKWGSKIHRCDFTVDTAAGQAVLDGSDIYQAHNIRGWYYIYPPLFAILMVPFALVPTFWAALAWYGLSVVLVIWTVKMCAFLVREALHFEEDPIALYALPPLLVLFPLMSALARGQTTPVVLWLVTAGLVCAWKGQDMRGAICFAGGILLKVFPIVLLAYFVWRKRWRLVMATLAATAVGAFIIPAAAYGWHRNIDYLKEWVDVIGKPALEAESERADNPLYGQLLNSQLPRNQSLSAVLTRLTGNPRARWIGMAVGAIMAGVILLVGRRAESSNEIHILSAAVVWTLLIPPVSWAHYFMLLLLPLTVLVAVAITARDETIRQVAVVALALFAILALGLAGSRAAQGYGPLCWGTLGIWGALLFASPSCPGRSEHGEPVQTALSREGSRP